MAAIGKICVGISLSFLYVFTAWRLWGWFAVPMGAPQISYGIAFGLYMLAASVLLWVFYADLTKTDDSAGLALGIAKGVISALLLFEGWIAHLFVTGAL